MSSLATSFFAWMRKRASSAQGETTPGFIVLEGKHVKQSRLDEKAQKSPIIVTLDSPEQASDAFPALEGAA